MAIIAKDDDQFQAALTALGLLAAAVGPALTPHVHHFLSPLNKRLGQRAFREPVDKHL